MYEDQRDANLFYDGPLLREATKYIQDRTMREFKRLQKRRAVPENIDRWQESVHPGYLEEWREEELPKLQLGLVNKAKNLITATKELREAINACADRGFFGFDQVARLESPLGGIYHNIDLIAGSDRFTFEGLVDFVGSFSMNKEEIFGQIEVSIAALETALKEAKQESARVKRK